MILAFGVIFGLVTAADVGTDSVALSDLSEYAHILTRHTRERYVADLEAIKRRGVLRVITRNNSVSYYIARGKQRGFEYDLAKAFAEHLGVRVTFVVPESRSHLMGRLLQGEGDLIAAGMSRTPARGEKVALTQPYFSTTRVVAVHEDMQPPPRTVEELSRINLHLSFRSTTYLDAQSLEQSSGLKLQLKDVRDGAEMETMLERVAKGEYQATLVDDVLLGLEQSAGLPLVPSVSVGGSRPKSWAVHPASTDLLVAANRFFSKNKRLVSRLYKRYFRSKVARLAREEIYRADRDGIISPYDQYFKEVGQLVGIDWRLLAAVAYTESRFDLSAESRFGAVGLMQLLPSTAKRVGLSAANLTKPKQNILAGGRYLARLINLINKRGKAKPSEVILFAIASYNCGFGHIDDARLLAEKTGKDPNKWFGQVEEAMRLKEKSKWHSQTRYGYARARETIAYVRKVQAQYEIYARHAPLDSVRESDSE